MKAMTRWTAGVRCVRMGASGAVGILAFGLLAGGLAGCGKPEGSGSGREPTNAAATKSTGSGNPLTAPVDYLGAVGAAQKQATKVVDLAPLQQAVKAFEAGEDRLPTGLMELIKEGYLPRLPEAPKGMVFAYNRQTGEVRLVPEVRKP